MKRGRKPKVTATVVIKTEEGQEVTSGEITESGKFIESARKGVLIEE